MKKLIQLLVVVAALTGAQGQDTYVGVGLTLATSFRATIPLVGIHVGGELSPDLGLRGSADTLLFGSTLGADLLYTPPLPGSDAHIYLGGGPDLLLVVIPMAAFTVDVGLHATAGVEHRFGTLGLYGELQPSYFFGIDSFLLKLRAGLNFHL